MSDLHKKIRELKRHGKRDMTGWVHQKWFIDFIDELIEILSEFKENEEK